MKHNVFIILVFALAFTALLAAEDTESRVISAYVGDTVTLPLEPLEGIWEHRVITQDLIAVTSSRQLEQRAELVLSMLRAGTGRLEAVRIMTNRVIDRKYFFFQIESKPAQTGPTNQAGANQEKAKPENNKKESAEQQDLDFALRIYEDGGCDEALQSFALFRSKYPSSPLLPQLALYEGEALCALKRPQEAIESLAQAARSEDQRIRSLASFWIGTASDALGKTDEAIAAYMAAFTQEYPDIDIRARTGLAVSYGRKGRAKLADEQFKRIFTLYAGTREQNDGYLPALFYAASFYDRDALDAELAVKYYQEFLSLANGALAKAETKPEAQARIRQESAEARARLAYLKSTFTDYR